MIKSKRRNTGVEVSERYGGNEDGEEERRGRVNQNLECKKENWNFPCYLKRGGGDADTRLSLNSEV